MHSNLAVGMLAHVDAGKTTLSEGMLYKGGVLRRLGRVDHKDAFLDANAMERRRGITIFAKQAVLPLDGITLTLLDTPGHVDFSAEMERTLQILDYAILVISGSEGVQGHTLTLWRLLERYRVPAFIFINKMDLAASSRGPVISALTAQLSSGCITFSGREDSQELYEDIAMCDDEALSEFLDDGRLSDDTVTELIKLRKLFPCFFGSALKLEGIEALLRGLERYAKPDAYPREFGAKVFKISRDNQNNRLTHIKITGGRLAVKAAVTGSNPDSDSAWSEKVNQIRVYSGQKFEAVDEARPGMVCAVTGLNHTYPGQGLGTGGASQPPALEPVLSYRVILPDGCDHHAVLRQLRSLEEEDPQLKAGWIERHQELRLHLMGEVQLEIVSQIILERFGLEVGFDAGDILYKETVAEPVIGVGHYEPLRHYAEVHLLLEPGERGSGLQFATACSEDVLHRSWQRLTLTHLAERQHPGVLTGSPVTDMKITLLTGRAHLSHTVGGDFREATYRAVRNGLMQAKSILLEPWYSYRLEVPADNLGRAMTDLQRISGGVPIPESNGAAAVFTGSAPVAALREYAADVTAYTRGLGCLSCVFSGFEPCRNQSEAVAAIGYDPEGDTENPADSVFCAHGAGFIVKWDKVNDHMHLDSGYRIERRQENPQPQPSGKGKTGKPKDIFALDKELMDIYERTYGPIKQRDILPKSKKLKNTAPPKTPARPVPGGPEYLLIDGYNIIHAWDDLNAVSRQNLDAARQILMDILSNYAGYRKREIILVFDAYRVQGSLGSATRYNNISVVYTKEAETADVYIEKVTYNISKKHRVTVATSDGTVQLIIFGHGALRMSPGMLREEIEAANEEIRDIISSSP